LFYLIPARYICCSTCAGGMHSQVKKHLPDSQRWVSEAGKSAV
jgi:hypothetical protein